MRIQSDRVSEVGPITSKNPEVTTLAGWSQFPDEHVPVVVISESDYVVDVGREDDSCGIDSRRIHRDSASTAHAAIAGKYNGTRRIQLNHENIGARGAKSGKIKNLTELEF